MADKQDTKPSIVDFVANLVSKSDARGVDSSYGSVVKDKSESGDLTSKEESRVDKIAKRFGKILKIGAFAEGPEARRNIGTGNVKGTEAIKDKVQSINTSSGTKSDDSGGLASFLSKVGIAAAVIGGLLLAFKDNETVQKILTKLGDVLGFLGEKFKQFIEMDWDAFKVIALVVGGAVVTAFIFALGKLALSLPIAALGLLALAGALAVLSKVLPAYESINWNTIKKAGAAIGGLGVIGVVLGKFGGLTGMIKAAVGLTVLSGALFVISKALVPFQDLDWDTIGKAGVALAGLGVIGTVFGKIGLGTLAKGAAGITLLGGSLWVLGEKGLKPFAALDWKTLGIGLAAVAGFGILGGIAGVFAPQILLGALAIGALGVALIPFAYAADMAAPAIEKIIGAFSNFYGNILEKMPPLVREIGLIITNVIDSVSTGVTFLISSLSDGVSKIFNGVKNIIKQSGDTIVNIANNVSDSVTRFFDKLANTIIKLNNVDTTRLKEIGPALASIGSGLAKFGVGGFFENILSGLGSLFGADSPLEKFEKLGKVAPDINKIPDALERLSKYKDLKFANLNVDGASESFKKLNGAAWGLMGTLKSIEDLDLDTINELIKILPKLTIISNSVSNIRGSGENTLFKEFTEEKIGIITKIDRALANLIKTTSNFKKINTDTFEQLRLGSKDLENITGSFAIKTTNTASDNNIKNLATDTTEYHNFAKTAMNDQIKRQDIMIDLLKQLVLKPTGSASINNNASIQQIPDRTFDIRERFNSSTMVPNNLIAK